MNKPFLKLFAIVFCMLSLFNESVAQSNNVFTVKANEVKGAIQPTMWGVFFEDINDGGIYAELVKNRSFEFFKPMMGWTIKPGQVKEGTLLVLNRQEKNTAKGKLQFTIR